MAQSSVVTGSHEVAEGSVRSYTIGFGLSVILTLCAFVPIMTNLVSGAAAVVLIMLLALAQLYVQVHYFLHLGSGSTRRWNLTIFSFMLTIVIIVVAGSLWIMRNLDYHHDTRTPEQVNQDIVKDENITN